MPPKKVEEPERKPLIGRVGTNLKVGIVGIPNVGKSTFFNVLTKSQAAAENFPFCTIDPNENKVLREIEKKSNEANQRFGGYSTESISQITNNKNSGESRGYDYDASSRNWPRSLSIWCPRASVYYAYTEDVNPFDRIEEFIENERKPANKTVNHIHFDPPLDPFTIRDPYEENAAREKYMRTEPVSFAVFGKPGSESARLADLISEWWKCILISPESLINEEIDKNTDKGRWILESLNRGETLEPHVIANLIDERIKGRDIMHRGYVVEGLPLIPENPEIEYATCPGDDSPEHGAEICCEISPCVVESEATSSSTENAASLTSFPLTLQRRGDFEINARIKLLQRATIQDSLHGVKQMAASKVRVNPFLNGSNDEVMHQSYKEYVPKQVDMIFQSWPVKPTIIVYITCPDEDADVRRQYLNPYSLLGKTSRRFDDAESPIDPDRSKENLIERVDAGAGSKIQFEIYKRYALPVIDRHVLRHNPQNVIRVEGRRTASQMFEVVSSKLRSLPYSRAIIPKRIFEYGDTFDAEGDEGFGAGDGGNLSGAIDEEVFEELTRKSTISSKFRWTISNWKFTCPVESAKGCVAEGKIEFAVRFMNKIFFLSSVESMNVFLENPRPFLVPMKPRPVCRIAIFGPRYSGKSELAEALAEEFQANVIDVRGLVKEMIDERINANIANAMRSAHVRVIEDWTARLKNERQDRETARMRALDSWLDEAEQMIRRLDQLQRENLAEDEAEHISDFRNELRANGLEEFESNRELLESAIENVTTLYDYAPQHLREEEQPVRELSEHDPEVVAILENEVKHLREDKIVITKEEIARSLISRIEMIPTEWIHGELSREPGCILDGMHPDPEIWSTLTEAGVLFNDVIRITEQSPYENMLRSWERYYDAKNESWEYDEDEYIEDYVKIEAMEDYIEEIRDFEEKWQLFSTVLEDGKTLICTFDETSNLHKIVSKHISEPYRPEAKIMSEKEREQELEDTVESFTDIDDETDEEFTHDRELEESKSKTSDQDTRTLGDTGIYCPVALARNNVLWKGKDEYSAVFLDKIYLCSSAEALENFVKSPEAFDLPFQRPITKIPFARICIVGPPGSGKSTFAKILAAENSMTHVDFSNSLRTYLHDRGIVARDREAEDLMERVDLPSDLTAERYDDDEDAILAFAQIYAKADAALPEKILNDCFLRFFKTPHDTSVIIFDSFPNCLEDVEIMVNNYAVPELVIELECSLETAQKRLLPELLESLMKKREIRKNTEGREDAEEWEEKENAEGKQEKNDEDENEKIEDDEEEIEDYEDETENYGSEGTIDEQEARYEILRKIEETYEQRNGMLDKARTRMEQEAISWIRINTDRDLDNLLPQMRKIVRPFLRKASPFERTQELDAYKADELLDCGYYFLSSFGRTCPVQMYERMNPFQMYLPMDERDDIHPILHRHYVYFVAGAEASEKFRKDPLRYILQDSCNPVIPARISIVGPPKSGKSTLAERFARAYGMRVINREDALRWTTKNYSWTKNAIEIKQVSRFDREVPKKLFARSVELYCSDYRSCTQGYILDGFPADREETEELALLNIRPMIVVNLQADRNFCLTSKIANDKQITRESLSLISQCYEKWREDSLHFLDWLTKFAQNIVDIDATGSKWLVWREADRQVCSRFADIKRYYREADYEKVHSLKSLLVTPYEFNKRQSPCKSYCPACLHYEDTMTFSGSPPDRRGVVQFCEYFYWICPRHRDEFMKNPSVCLPPQSTATLPAVRPRVLDDEIDVEHACWARRLVADGNCVVTYADALPDCVILPGKRNIGILYEDRLYLFCSLKCRERFLSRAPFYGKVVIDSSKAAATIATRNLTNLEYLEKTMAEYVINSLTSVAAKRPKYPGMSEASSAAIYIAIYLKIHNVKCSLDEIQVYEEVHRRLEARMRIIKIATKNMMKMNDPSRRVPVPDSRFDYLCEYFKPASKVPAFLNVVDIAGLVKGAAEGQGLGNAFLSHISACDAIFHLCRAFEDDDVTHIEGEVNPVRDLEIISEELRLKDIEFLGVHLEKLEKLVVRGNDKKLKPEYDALLKVKNILHEEKKHIRFADWSVNEIDVLNKYLFLTSKPVIYLVNLSEKDYIRKKNKWLIKIKEWVDKNDPGASLIPFSGAFENKVIDMDPAEAAKYFEESKVTSALDKIIVQGYKALQLQYFFTAGHDEVKAWTIQKGTKAPQAAGRIHTDFEKGFIMAEVMKYEDFAAEGSETGVKAAGKYRQQGRNYVVEDGDIIFFKFNAGAGLKDAKKK